MIAADHSKIKVFNIIMVLALAFALVAGAIAVKTATTVSAQWGNNTPPIAEAGPDQAVQSISTTVHTGGFPNVQLDGSMSFDSNLNDSLSYSWSLTDPTINLVTNPGGSHPISGDYSTANGWPAAGTGATLTGATTSTPILNLSAATAGLYPVWLTVTDNGVSPDDLSAIDYVVVVAGQTWFVALNGNDSWNGQKPARDQGSIGPWRRITFAIENPLVKHGDRIMVGPNDSDGSQNDAPNPSTTPAYALSGFGGNSANNNEQIDVNKWLTIWSTNGRNDKSELLADYATTINVSEQNGTGGLYNVDQVVKISWPHGQSVFTTAGLNAEKCGVVFGCNNHGFDLIGAPTGIYAEGADAVYIHQNRIEEMTVIVPSVDYNFFGINIYLSKAPTVDDNIVLFDGNDDGASVIGINLLDCDESLPNLLWYNAIPVSGIVVGTLNVKGGAQVINNVVILQEQNIVEGIILTNCPKALVYNNFVHCTVKECTNAYSVGIGLYGTDEDACNWSLVDLNIVIVDVDGKMSAIGKGIVVEDCYVVMVTRNNVQVQATGESPFSMGGLLGIGIDMYDAPGSQVLTNTVDVNNVVSSLQEEAGAVQVVAPGDGIQDLTSDELADLQSAFDDIFSDDYSPTVMFAASLAIGIYAFGSDDISIGSTSGEAFTGNMVDVCSRVTLLAANYEDDIVGDPIDEITLKCAGASLAQGITVLECDGAVVATNQIIPSPTVTEPDGDTVGVHSWLSFVVNQYVPAPPLTPTPTPTPEALPDGIGKSGAIGILVFNSDTDMASVPVTVLYNTVIVLGEAEIQLSGAEVETLSTSFPQSVLGQVESAIIDMMAAAGEVASSPDVDLYSLAIPPFGGVGHDEVLATFDPDAFAKGKGLVFGIGIATLESTAAVVIGNIVHADSKLQGIIVSETGTEDVLPMSDAVIANGLYNLSFAVGILNYMCGITYPPYPVAPTTISKNLVTAFADADIYVEAAQIVANSDGGGDVEARGSGMSIGAGILVIGLENTYDQATVKSFADQTFTPPSDAIVTNNSASGDGYFCLDVEGYNLVDEQLAKTDAESVGLGGGIVVIGQMFPLISGNGYIDIYQRADTLHPYGYMVDPLHAVPYVTGDELYPDANFVYGNGQACVETDAIGLAQEDPDADGDAVALGVGIATVFCLDPQITNNCNFHKLTYAAPNATNGSELTPYDPDQPFVAGSAQAQGFVKAINQVILVGSQETYADGGAWAAGVGILVAGCEGAYVSHNHAEGFHSGFYNYPVDAIDSCFLPFNCDTYQTPYGNTDYDPAVDGYPVWALVDVLAVDQDSLEYVQATALGAAIACGILLGDVSIDLGIADYEVHLPYCVTESNTFEAGACIDITGAVAIGDPVAIKLGLAAAIDAFIVFATEDVNTPPDTTFDIQPVVFNYNDMPGLRLSCAGGDGTFWVDFGMLVVNLNAPYVQAAADDSYDVDLLLVDARYNYWGNPLIPTIYTDPTTFNLTGPGGLGAGLGQPIYVVSDWWTTWVIWQPWLTINHEWALDSHIGKFGKIIELDKCWNTFSIPIALDDVAVPIPDDGTAPYNTWEGFKALNPDFASAIGPAVYWDPHFSWTDLVTDPDTHEVTGGWTGGWVNLQGTDVLEPMMGFKVYVKNDTFVTILASTADTMPTLPVYEGWNLVGPNPPFCDPGLWVSDFISSLVRTSGMDGFTQVVSQGGSQRNWSYTIGDWVQDEGDQFMKIGKGYWVYMNGDQTLAGFGFTRLPLYPEHFYH